MLSIASMSILTACTLARSTHSENEPHPSKVEGCALASPWVGVLGIAVSLAKTSSHSSGNAYGVNMGGMGVSVGPSLQTRSSPPLGHPMSWGGVVIPNAHGAFEGHVHF